MPPSPRVVRNFWLKGTVDGRRSSIRGGPRTRDGGFLLTLYQRSGGEVSAALSLHGLALSDGTLVVEVKASLSWSFQDGTLRIETKR